MIHKLINKISKSSMGQMFDFAEKGNRFLLKDFLSHTTDVLKLDTV